MKEETIEFGKRSVALKYIEDRVVELMKIHHPDYVTIENPFFCSRFPNAYSALVEVMCTITRAIYVEYKLPIFKISPKLAKHAIFGSGDGKKKDIINAVKNHDKIMFQQEKNKNKLNEHEADCIAVTYAFIMNILPGFMLKKGK
jgi:Holliday junction resolvasome RuvABC endonuclease subunit